MCRVGWWWCAPTPTASCGEPHPIVGLTKEGLRGPRAPKLGTPQVRGPVASLWFVRVQAGYCGCGPFGSEGSYKPPTESLERRSNEFFQHRRLQVDMELSFIHYTECVLWSG